MKVVDVFSEHKNFAEVPDPPCVGCRQRLRCQAANLACYHFAMYCGECRAIINRMGTRWQKQPDDPRRSIYETIFRGDDNG
jgi:hypothetical protein